MIFGETERRGFAATLPFAQAVSLARKPARLGLRKTPPTMAMDTSCTTFRAGDPAPAAGLHSGARISKQGQEPGEVGFVPSGSFELAAE